MERTHLQQKAWDRLCYWVTIEWDDTYIHILLYILDCCVYGVNPTYYPGSLWELTGNYYSLLLSDWTLHWCLINDKQKNAIINQAYLLIQTIEALASYSDQKFLFSVVEYFYFLSNPRRFPLIPQCWYCGGLGRHLKTITIMFACLSVEKKLLSAIMSWFGILVLAIELYVTIPGRPLL